MTRDEILKIWGKYAGEGTDAVVLFAREVQGAETARMRKKQETLTITCQKLEAALLRWEKDFRIGTDTLPQEPATAESAKHLWAAVVAGHIWDELSAI